MIIIYKLYDDEDCYVGSTTQTLGQRLSNHKNRRSCKSVIILDRNKYKIELIEEVETNNRYEREQYWIDKLSTLSQHNCYWKNVKEKTEEYKKKYRENNKEYYIEYHKKNYETNKQSITERNKKYRENNKEKVKERHKQYEEKNKQKILERKSEKITCECGKIISRGCKSKHLKSKKHLAYIYEEGQK